MRKVRKRVPMTAHVRSFLASTLNSAAATSIGAPMKHSLTALHRNAKGGWAAATGVTAVHAPMGPGRLAACREPWVEVKLGTPPRTCLEAFTPQEQPSAGFCRDLDRAEL